MKKLFFTVFLIFIFLIGCGKESNPTTIFDESFSSITDSSDQQLELDLIKPKEREKKLKIAIIQSDVYYEYYEAFTSIYSALESLGWIKETDILKKNYVTNINFLTTLKDRDYSEYIEFSPQLYYSFGSDEVNAKDKKFLDLMKQINNGEVDLVILMGTLASQIVLTTPDYHTPTLVDAVTDPIGSGILVSETDSGKDFLTGRVDKNQYIRQVKLFHDVIGFDKLALIYEDSENGRSYAAVDSVEAVSKETGFQIINNHNAMAEPSEKELAKAYKMYLDALDSVCPQSQAIFLGVSGGLEDLNMPNVVEKLVKYKIPSFTMEGTYMVKKGAMLGVSGKETGMYNAKKIAMILNGAVPRNLTQIYEKTPRISINLKMTKLINYDVPVDVVKSADEIFYSIEGVD